MMQVETKNPPLITVVIPAYNSERTIASTLDSMSRQTYGSFEVLVVDDGSTDATPGIIERYCVADPRFRYIRKENGGTASAYDLGMREARGPWIAVGAADDLFESDCLMTQAQAMQAHPGFQVYCANGYVFQEEEGWRYLALQGRQWKTDHEVVLDSLSVKCILSLGAVYNRAAGLSIGGYTMGLLTEDFDFWLRLMVSGNRFWYTAKTLALFRESAHQRSSAYADMDAAHVETLRRVAEQEGVSRHDIDILVAAMPRFLQGQRNPNERLEMVRQREAIYAKIERMPQVFQSLFRFGIHVFKPVARPLRGFLAHHHVKGERDRGK